MTFPTRLDELIAKATKGPWRFIEREVLEDKSVYPRHIIGGKNELQVLVMETPHCAQELHSDPKKFPELNAYQLANTELIVHLVNHAEAIRDLVVAAEKVVEWTGNEQLREALAKLEE